MGKRIIIKCDRFVYFSLKKYIEHMGFDCEIEEACPDSNVEKNRKMLLERSLIGFKKYGTTTERNDLSLRDWLQHALEEALDMANYLQAAISKLDKENGKTN